MALTGLFQKVPEGLQGTLGILQRFQRGFRGFKGFSSINGVSGSFRKVQGWFPKGLMNVLENFQRYIWKELKKYMNDKTSWGLQGFMVFQVSVPVPVEDSVTFYGASERSRLLFEAIL